VIEELICAGQGIVKVDIALVGHTQTELLTRMLDLSIRTLILLLVIFSVGLITNLKLFSVEAKSIFAITLSS